MNRKQEKVLVATLCGMVVLAASAFAVQPSFAFAPVAEVILVF